MKMNLHLKRCRRNSQLGLIPNFHIETLNQNNCYQGNQIKKLYLNVNTSCTFKQKISRLTLSHSGLNCIEFLQKFEISVQYITFYYFLFLFILNAKWSKETNLLCKKLLLFYSTDKSLFFAKF